MDDKILSGEVLDEEDADTNIRPDHLNEYIGQEDVKQNIKVIP